MALFLAHGLHCAVAEMNVLYFFVFLFVSVSQLEMKDDDDVVVFYVQVAASFAVLTIAVSTWIGNVMDLTIVTTTVTNRTAVSSMYIPCHRYKTC